MMTAPKDPCRIAVVGCGAIGQFYAAQLSLAGHDLRLLARRDAETLTKRGLVVLQTAAPQAASSLTQTRLHIAPQRLLVSRRPEDLVADGYPDWILIALKTTALHEARALVAPLVSPHSRIVVLCNGLGVEDRFAEWFGGDRIFGMLCFVAVNRDDDGTIRHLAYGHVSVGHYRDAAPERAKLLELFEGAGITCECPQSLLEARWRKLGWNLPFNGLCLLYDCTTDAIVGDPSRREFALELSRETVTVGNLDLAAHGLPAQIEPTWADLQIERTRTMGAYAPSTLLDARVGRALEVDMMFLEPVRRAKRLGGPTGALDRLIDGLTVRGFISG